MASTMSRGEKRLGNINVHLTERREVQLRRLAEHAGLSASAYISQLIEDHLLDKFHEHRLLAQVFAGDSSLSSPSSEASDV